MRRQRHRGLPVHRQAQAPAQTCDPAPHVPTAQSAAPQQQSRSAATISTAQCSCHVVLRSPLQPTHVFGPLLMTNRSESGRRILAHPSKRSWCAI